MTTLYRPVLIETVEQAEALPVGTVAYDEGRMHGPLLKEADNYWFGDRSKDNEEVADYGYTALVPVEAEEETNTRWDEGDPVNTPTRKRRLVTPWEEA